MTRCSSTTATVVLGLLLLGPAARADERDQLRLFERSARLFDAAVAATRRGDEEAAVRHYERALRADPDFVEAMVNLAQVHFEAGRHELARDWLERAEGSHPDYPRIALLRGLLALREGDARHAHEQLGLAHRQAPDDPAIAVDLAAVLIEVGRPTQAIELLEEVLSAFPEHVEAIYDLALARDLAGDRDRAAYGYERFLALSSVSDAGRAAVQRRLSQLSAGDAATPDAEEVSLASQAPSPQGEQE